MFYSCTVQDLQYSPWIMRVGQDLLNLVVVCYPSILQVSSGFITATGATLKDKA